MTQKFYKTTLVIEVLAADYPWDGSIETLGDDITVGPFCGDIRSDECVELTREQMASALYEHRSTPGFLIMDWDEAVP